MKFNFNNNQHYINDDRLHIPKKWSEISYEGIYNKSDYNRQVVLGYFLITLGINLEKLPLNLFESYIHYPTKRNFDKEMQLQKIYVKDIVGTSRQEYAEDNQVLFSFMKLKRITDYIKQGSVTPNKYFHHLKKRTQKSPIILSRNSDDTFFVDGNGNHRVLTYKIMMLSAIAQKYNWVYDDSYNLSFKGFDDITKNYWLYAMVNE